MCLISIVVPMYNAEISIERCIKSILNQSYNSYELIIIDDGSTDKSKEIVSKYIEKNDNIKYFYQNNRGVSSARNFGLSKCVGEYVCFIDADDYVDENYICTFKKNIIQNTEMICCGYNINGKRISSNKNKVISFKKFEYYLLKKEYFKGYLWNKIFSLNIIKENNISFNEDIHFGEDTLFCYKYMKCISSVTIISKSLYFYNISDKMKYFDKGIDYLLNYLDELLLDSKNPKIINSYKYEFVIRYIFHNKFYNDDNLLEFTRNNYLNILFSNIKLKYKIYMIVYLLKNKKKG